MLNSESSCAFLGSQAYNRPGHEWAEGQKLRRSGDLHHSVQKGFTQTPA